MIELSRVSLVLLPRELADAGQEYLREAGLGGFEGLVLWAGRLHGGAFWVEQILMPAQERRRSALGLSYSVEGEELFKVNRHLHENGLTLIAQVHSHPSDAYHSEVDDAYPIVTAEGCLSIVIPDFAARPFTLEDCAVYRLKSAGRWVELSLAEVAGLLELVE